jgi:hypothetical protein
MELAIKLGFEGSQLTAFAVNQTGEMVDFPLKELCTRGLPTCAKRSRRRIDTNLADWTAVDGQAYFLRSKTTSGLTSFQRWRSCGGSFGQVRICCQRCSCCKLSTVNVGWRCPPKAHRYWLTLPGPVGPGIQGAAIGGRYSTG